MDFLISYASLKVFLLFPENQPILFGLLTSVITFRKLKFLSATFLPSCNDQWQTGQFLCFTTGTLFGISGCRSFHAGSVFDQDCKYNLKKRKSYISCLPEESGSSALRPLPLKVAWKSSSFETQMPGHRKS
ncbi:MAG: hypothetical protein FDX30_00405 [Chlorobium sp.]|nr:MAG: hypothetical protein FDX30_00405 [Chlorobium sp.]